MEHRTTDAWLSANNPFGASRSLKESNIEARVSGREKRLYSIYRKMVQKELQFSEIGRLFGKNANWAGVTFFRAKKKLLAMMKEADNDE